MSERIQDNNPIFHITITAQYGVVDIDFSLNPALAKREEYITPRPTTSLNPDLLDIPVGHVVKSWREHLGFKLTELASSTGIPKGYLSQIEHGKIQAPNSAILRKLSAALGISPWDLIHRQYPDSNQ